MHVGTGYLCLQAKRFMIIIIIVVVVVNMNIIIITSVR